MSDEQFFWSGTIILSVLFVLLVIFYWILSLRYFKRLNAQEKEIERRGEPLIVILQMDRRNGVLIVTDPTLYELLREGRGMDEALDRFTKPYREDSSSPPYIQKG